MATLNTGNFRTDNYKYHFEVYVDETHFFSMTEMGIKLLVAILDKEGANFFIGIDVLDPFPGTHHHVPAGRLVHLPGADVRCRTHRVVENLCRHLHRVLDIHPGDCFDAPDLLSPRRSAGAVSEDH